MIASPMHPIKQCRAQAALEFRCRRLGKSHHQQVFNGSVAGIRARVAEAQDIQTTRDQRFRFARARSGDDHHIAPRVDRAGLGCR